MKASLTIAGGLLAAFVADAASLDRQDLEKKLQDLAKAPAPTKLAPGAMCYDMAMPSERIEYVCPICSEKTLYANDKTGFWGIRDAGTYRRLAKQLQEKGLDCKLDESAFCQKCGKDIKEKTFVLETKWPGQEKPHRATVRNPNELTLIQEFLEGKMVHQGIPGDGRGETPLKNHLPRLRELLGLQAVAKPDEKKP